MPELKLHPLSFSS